MATFTVNQGMPEQQPGAVPIGDWWSANAPAAQTNTGGFTGQGGFNGVGFPQLQSAPGTPGLPFQGGGMTQTNSVGGAITNQQDALQAALSQGLQGQAAVDWVQQNYPQFNQYGSGIEWQPSSGTYGLQGGYFAQNPQTGSWGMVPRGGGLSGGGAEANALGANPGYGIFQQLAGGMTPDQILANDPGFQFRLQQGANAIDRSAASKGTLLTGGTLKDLAEFGQGLASSEYGNVFNRQLQLAGLGSGLQNQAFGQNLSLADLGLSAQNAQNALATSYGNNATGLLTGAGNASAAGSLAQGGIWGNAIQGLGGVLGNIWNRRTTGTDYSGVTPGQSSWWNLGNQGPVLY